MKLLCNHFCDQSHHVLARASDAGTTHSGRSEKVTGPSGRLTGTEKAPQSATPCSTVPVTRLLLPRKEAA